MVETPLSMYNDKNTTKHSSVSKLCQKNEWVSPITHDHGDYNMTFYMNTSHVVDTDATYTSVIHACILNYGFIS